MANYISGDTIKMSGLIDEYDGLWWDGDSATPSTIANPSSTKISDYSVQVGKTLGQQIKFSDFYGANKLTPSISVDEPEVEYLYHTYPSQGNRRRWTFNVWVNRNSLSSHTERLFFARSSSGAVHGCSINGTNKIEMGYYSDASGLDIIYSSGSYTSTSDWMQLTYIYDTPNATASERTRLYVDGQRISTTGNNYPSQNFSGLINAAGIFTAVGYAYQIGEYLNAKIAMPTFVDGYALSPNNFVLPVTLSNSTTVNKPIFVDKSYLTGNSFILPFLNKNALGQDYSPSGSNSYSANNLSSSDWTEERIKR